MIAIAGRLKVAPARRVGAAPMERMTEFPSAPLALSREAPEETNRVPKRSSVAGLDYVDDRSP